MSDSVDSTSRPMPLFEPLEPRLLLDATTTYGGLFFYGRQDIAVGDGPRGIVSADFDGDGRADLAVTNYWHGDVSVLYGLPGGGLGDREDVAVGDGPRGIATADFDGDGRADLAVTNFYDDVSVLYGLPGGGFGDRVDVAVGDGPAGIATADFDGDGRADLAVANNWGDDVSVLYGQTGGGFGGRVDVAVGNEPWAIVTADFDGDGRADVAVANHGDDHVSVLYGQAGGGFGDREDVAVGEGPEAIVSADFDGDGRADLAVTNRYDHDVSVLYGLPGGGFGGRVDVAVGYGPLGIATADFDGDGRADLAVTNFYDADVSVLYGLPGGGFGGREDVAVGDCPKAIVSADFDGDGRLDLAVPNVGDDDVSVLYGLAGGGFGGREDVAVGNWPGGIVSANFNGDGRADLAVTNASDNDVSVLYGQPGGGFGDREDVAVGDDPSGIATADFDGDGRADLAVTTRGHGDVSVLYGLPGGGFGGREDVAVGNEPRGIATADFNGDGRADLAVTNYSDGDVSVLYGLPGGGLGGREGVAVGNWPWGIVSADLNGDGRADLAVTNYSDDDVSVLYGQAGGGFGGREDVAVGDWPRGIATADFNGDGRADLAVANRSDDDVSVLYNGGVGATLQQWVYNSAFLTDAQMEQYSSMSEEEVRAFLAAQDSYFRQPVADADGVVFDMASVIVDAALRYEINPKVLLATMEKESAAVTTPTRPTETRMRLLMGAGAASTARAQVQEAARLYRAYLDELDADGMTRSGWQVGVGKTTLDGVRVVPATRAVAALFTYTPYVGAQWGGNQPQWGGTYLFHHYWDAFAFDSEVPSLPAPTGLVATAASDSEIALAWDAVPDAAGYRLERRAETSGTWAGLATLGAMTDYQDTGLSTDSQYYYRLAAYCDEGASPWSRTVAASPREAVVPQISRVAPSTPFALGQPEPFTVHGANFDGAAAVSLQRSDGGGFCLPAISRSATHITVNATFDTPGQWSVQVINPAGSSAEHSFTVREPSSEPETHAWQEFKQNFEFDTEWMMWQVNIEAILDEDGFEKAIPEAEKSLVTGDYKPFNQEAGMQEFLTFILNDPKLNLCNTVHRCWAAYMFATTRHETCRAWHPIQEVPWGWYHDPWTYFEYTAGEPPGYGGRGGNGAKGQGEGFRYRGRGYVQTTLKDNYERFSFEEKSGNTDFKAYLNVFRAALGMPGLEDLDLVANPNLALEPEMAYAIMSFGMRRGSFRGECLGEHIYMTDDKELVCHYADARGIVNNPLDDPEAIAGYAEEFQAALDNLPRSYIANGSFVGGEWAGWSTPRPSSVGVVELLPGSWWSMLTAQSPVAFYQMVTTPMNAFEFSFDYHFPTTTGTLDVLLDSVVLGTVNAPETLNGEPSSFSVRVTDSSLWGLEDARLAFRFDGPTGSQILLSNIVLGPAATGMPVPEIAGHMIAGGLEQRSAVGEVGASFSGDVSGSLLTDNLLLENLDTGQTIQADRLALEYDAASNTATWTFPGLAEGLLPEGNYRATVLAEGLADTTGTPVIDDHSFEFHVLKGDATGDAKTNIFDLLMVRQNYLEPADDPTRDDNADVTGDGSVNIFDLLMVRQNYLRELEESAGAALASMVLAAEGSPQPLAPSSESGVGTTLTDYAELSVLTRDSEGGTESETAVASVSASAGLIESGAAVSALSNGSDATLLAHEPLADVTTPVYPVAEDIGSDGSEHIGGEGILTDVLAVPPLEVALGA